MTTRMERDTFGLMEIGCEYLSGAQTQRSLAHFNISTERMPSELIVALAEVTRAAAIASRGHIQNKYVKNSLEKRPITMRPEGLRIAGGMTPCDFLPEFICCKSSSK